MVSPSRTSLGLRESRMQTGPKGQRRLTDAMKLGRVLYQADERPRLRAKRGRILAIERGHVRPSLAFPANLPY